MPDLCCWGSLGARPSYSDVFVRIKAGKVLSLLSAWSAVSLSLLAPYRPCGIILMPDLRCWGSLGARPSYSDVLVRIKAGKVLRWLICAGPPTLCLVCCVSEPLSLNIGVLVLIVVRVV